MDFFDPSCEPGVCAPIPGGPSAGEGLRLLRGFSGLHFVAFDLNTVSPPHDVRGMTAQLAAQVMYDCLVLLGHVRTRHRAPLRSRALLNVLNCPLQAAPWPAPAGTPA